MTLPKQVLIKEKFYWWDGWMASPIRWTSLSKLWELVMDKKTRCAAIHGIVKSWTRQSDWTEHNFGAVGEFLLYNHGLGACLVAQPYPTLRDPIEGSLPGSSVHWIIQARMLEWIAIHLPRGSSWHRNQTQVSCIAGGFFTVWATREAQ